MAVLLSQLVLAFCFPSSTNLFFCICTFFLYNIEYKILTLIYDVFLYFHSINRLWVHPYHYKWPSFAPFYGQVIFHCIYVLHLIHLSVSGHIGYSHLLDIVNSAVLNMGCIWIAWALKQEETSASQGWREAVMDRSWWELVIEFRPVYLRSTLTAYHNGLGFWRELWTWVGFKGGVVIKGFGIAVRNE